MKKPSSREYVFGDCRIRRVSPGVVKGEGDWQVMTPEGFGYYRTMRAAKSYVHEREFRLREREMSRTADRAAHRHAIKIIFDQHIKDGGMITAPDKLIGKLVNELCGEAPKRKSSDKPLVACASCKRMFRGTKDYLSETWSVPPHKCRNGIKVPSRCGVSPDKEIPTSLERFLAKH